MYDLCVDGVNDFYARRVGGRKQLRREPLSGLVDGSNLVFMAPLYPLVESSIKLYLDGVLHNTTYYTVDADLGVFTLYAAPDDQPQIDAQATPLTRTQVIQFAFAGFQLMESLWRRGFQLSSDPTQYLMADYDSPHMYVCEGPVTSGQPVVDPVCGALTFATSPLQRQVLSRAIELAYLDCQAYELALSDVDFAERVGGARISALRRPENVKAAREIAYRELDTAVFAAILDEDPTGTALAGGHVTNRHTTEYTFVWQWQNGLNGTGMYVPVNLNPGGRL